MMRRRTFMSLAAGALASSLAPRFTAAQAYPARPVTLVIPFPPGGGNDALGRMVADKMSKSLGQQIVVENRGGAGGTIATRAVARSAADGYTILLAYTGTLAINPSLYVNPGYDPRRDFAPIGLIAGLPSVLVVHPTFPVRSVAELIAFAKARPGRIDYAFVPGTVGHITTELFASTAGIDFTRIPYKGNGPAMTDLLGGHVAMMFLSILPVLEHVRAGTLKALAVTSAARSELLPQVPTIAQAGLPGFSAVIHYGLLAPPGTPRGIIDQLNAALREALAADDVRARLAAEGAAPLPGTPADYAADIDTEETKWGALVRKLNLRVE
ncbi:MAG TPA: tripartite tricarboxylate transporter substrate binding protein [Xanthobacteraceae bacterium]|nr:tripartite tricarboxylate transporter substrate binding protein [Xanthobacteraceae bacterium]